MGETESSIFPVDNDWQEYARINPRLALDVPEKFGFHSHYGEVW
jgi:hypothetical protein